MKLKIVTITRNGIPMQVQVREDADTQTGEPEVDFDQAEEAEKAARPANKARRPRNAAADSDGK